MSTGILFDGLNFSLKTGTGIATYTKMLVRTVKDLGYSPEILVSSNAGFNKRDPLFSEIALLDPVIANHPSPKIRAQLQLTRMFGRPFGLHPSSFARLQGVTKESGVDLGAFERVHASPEIFETARLHFRRRKECLQVRLDEPPALFHATYPAPVRVRKACNIYTIHDLIPLLIPSATLDDKKYTIELLRSLCRHADHIVTVSENSRRDIIRLLNVEESRVTNTYQCVTINEDALSQNDAELAQGLESAFGVSPGEYSVFIGAIEPKKNLRRLIDAYAASGTSRPLLIVGGLGWQYEDDVKKLSEERFLRYAFDGTQLRPQRMVRHLSYLPRTQLLSLIKGARALLFPSLYEGFGLPVLEAMLLGTAVLAADVSSLPEIVGDAGLLVDPHDERAIASGIRALDQDADLISTLVARGFERARLFSPHAYASRLADLYSRLGLGSTQPVAETSVATVAYAH